MMRILHFIPAFGIGGMESLVMSLYRAIDRSRIQFDFLVETPQWLTEFDEITAMGGRVYQIERLNKRQPWRYVSHIKQFFQQYSNNFDVIHSHNIERSVVVLHYAKKYGVSCRISHAHKDSLKDSRFERLSQLLLRINNKLSTNYLACSKQAGEFYFAKDSKPYEILKNAIDTKIFCYDKAVRNTIREQLGMSEGFVIGHTGRFNQLKNHHKIIDVFAQLYQRNNAARLLLVGDGPLLPEIQHKVGHYGLTKVVHFAGGQSSVIKYLQCMDAFILPSLFEGFCLSLLEAQSVGLPCLASDAIPDEVQVTELVHTLSLQESDDVWAEKLDGFFQYKRSSRHETIIDKGYDTEINGKWLLNFYLESLVSCSRQTKQVNNNDPY